MRLLLVLLVACGAPSTDPSVQLGDDDDDDVVQDDTSADDTAPPDDEGWPPLRINEFMASNASTIQDPTGAWADWVELFNPADEDVDLDGWAVADSFEDSEPLVLEQLTIPAGGVLLLWADDDTDEGPDHLDFNLAATGDKLVLLDPDGEVADALTFGQQATDMSSARVTDGSAEWMLTAEPTPEASNGIAQTPLDDIDSWPEPGPPCDLDSDLDTPWFTEGDTIEATLACTGELSTAEASIEPVRLPDAAVLDTDSLLVTWVTGVSDGGPVEIVFSTRPADSPTAMPTAETLALWVADDPSNPDNVPVDPETYTEEWGLPVFHITPDEALSQSYTSAALVYQGHTYDAQIKIRGATSAYYPKPSYTLEFDEEEIQVEEWGVTRDHLILLTTFDDNSYVRQKLVYDLWAAMADYWGEDRLTPRCYFAVLYMDGAYTGLYVALDRIDNEFLDQMGFDRDANLYKSVNHDANFYLTNSSGSTKSTLHDGYEKKEGEPDDDFSDLEDLVEFTGNADAAELIDGAGDWLDIPEFMDWFLLVQYSLAEDSAGKNAYLYNVADDTGFRYAPWDMNHSWGQGWYTYRTSTDDLNTYTWNNRIFWAFQEDDDAETEMWERFSSMREDGPLAGEWLVATVDEYYALIEPSAQRDWATWGDSYLSYGGWAGSRSSAGDWTDYEGEKAYLYDWLDGREAVYLSEHP